MAQKQENNYKCASKMLLYCGLSVGIGIGIGYLSRRWYERKYDFAQIQQKFGGSQEMYNYLQNVANRSIPELVEIKDQTMSKFPTVAKMITAVDQMYLFRWLVSTLRCKKVIEIGVFTGSSALAIADGLPPNGKLIAIDVDKDYTDLAKEMWQKRGVSDRIELSLEGGIAALDRLLQDPSQKETVDFAYIDAIKKEYWDYFEKLLPLMKKGGVIAFDNVLQGGKVAIKGANEKANVKWFRVFNQTMKLDKRVDICLITLGDGLLFATKK